MNRRSSTIVWHNLRYLFYGVYLPTLGRSLQVDPVLGGTPNAYVYVPDPVNGNDYSGLCFSCLLQPAGSGSLFQNAGGYSQQKQVKVTGRIQVATPRRAARTAPSVSVKPRVDSVTSGVFIPLFSKNKSQGGRGYQSPSGPEADAYYRKKAGRGDYNKKDYKRWESKRRANEKFQGKRNSQKDSRGDDDDNNPTSPPNIPPNPYIVPGGDGSISGEAVVGGGIGIGVILWWGGKLLSPVCGPALPVCAVAF